MDAAGRPDLLNEWMNEPGFFADLKPMPGAIEGFNALRAQGHDVVVATSIPGAATHAFDGKRAWMGRWFPDWSMKNFIACSRKGLLDGDFLVDDGEHNIRDWYEAKRRGGIVFDAPWNRNQNFPRGTRRARDWEEVVQIVSLAPYTNWL